MDKNDLHNHYLSKRGWHLINRDFDQQFHFMHELKYVIVGASVAALMFFPLLLILIFIYYKNLFTKGIKGRHLFGTEPIISLKMLKKILEGEYDTTIFLYEDSFQRTALNNLVTIADIVPALIAKKYPRLLGRYVAFVWALYNFDVFHFHFDSGFLDRTIFWRLEPLIYTLFRKKIILYSYGADRADLFRNNDFYYKYGLMSFNKKYFYNDFYKIRRNYHWSKYATFIFGNSDQMKYLPRLDSLTYNFHVFSDDEIQSKQKDNACIKVFHCSNNVTRKGSHIIEKVLSSIAAERDDFVYVVKQQISRDEFLTELSQSHVFIEQVAQGFPGYAAYEGLMSGNVVIGLFEQKYEDFYHLLMPDYYNDFLSQNNLISASAKSLRQELIGLLENKKDLLERCEESRQKALKRNQDNREAYMYIMKQITRSQG